MGVNDMMGFSGRAIDGIKYSCRTLIDKLDFEGNEGWMYIQGRDVEGPEGWAILAAKNPRALLGLTHDLLAMVAEETIMGCEYPHDRMSGELLEEDDEEDGIDIEQIESWGDQEALEDEDEDGDESGEDDDEDDEGPHIFIPFP
jgi:hypothetical protein